MSGTNRPGNPSRVAVLRSGGEFRLVAREFVPADSRLFAIEGDLSTAPTRYSVQLGHGVHLDLLRACAPEEMMDRFFWRFMNHSCEPSALIQGRDVVALKPIEPWQEITFHYNTTEYEMSEPFHCRCGSGLCAGVIRGFRFASRPERERLRPWLPDYLLALLDDADLAGATTGSSSR